MFGTKEVARYTILSNKLNSPAPLTPQEVTEFNYLKQQYKLYLELRKKISNPKAISIHDVSAVPKAIPSIVLWKWEIKV